MLKLVVDNCKAASENLITCRNSCELFDGITGSCSVKEKVNVDSSYEASCCGHFLNKDVMATQQKCHTQFKFSLIEEENDYLIDDEIFHELIGNRFNKTESTYPLKPDVPSKSEDAKWYVSRCGTFGCWLINQYKKPLSLPSKIDCAEKGWSKNVYKSPVPLHNHKTSLSLSSRIAWVIDEDGYGQYALLVNGRISTISSPKPINWKRKY